MKSIRSCEICGREFTVSTEHSRHKICMRDDCIALRNGIRIMHLGEKLEQEEAY